ncbi:hypothetical protein U0070_017033 [Myodes glareolus]|uniref:Uncharacterized protein n=1 Tax=Myodes glareolus TaxID=447135 RepID=A0AAW0HQM7_MYOGA
MSSPSSIFADSGFGSLCE